MCACMCVVLYLPLFVIHPCNKGGGVLDSLCPFPFVPSLSGYLLNCSTIHNKLGTVVHYHESECYVENLVSYLQGEGHSESLYNQNDEVTFLKSKHGTSEILQTALCFHVHLSSTLLPFLDPCFWRDRSSCPRSDSGLQLTADLSRPLARHCG